MKPQTERHDAPITDEAGQTIALIVFMIIGLLAFVGMAADAGILFARSTQFSAAVDAAALAGVVEMDPTINDLTRPDARAKQFLAANGWPTATMTFSSTMTLTNDGFPEYGITVTWPVQTFFLRVIGFEDVPVTRDATAVYRAHAEAHTPTAKDFGQVRKGSLFIMGPNSCTKDGDVISSEHGASTSQPNTDAAHLSDATHRYRIRVATDVYTATTLRVELFDPDSVNANLAAGASIQYSDYWAGVSGESTTVRSCTTDAIAGGGVGQPCTFRIEDTTTLDRYIQNPLWLVRVDENFSPDCSPNPGDPNTPSGNTVTEYTLYYVDDNDDPVEIASYTDNNSDLANTDLKWISPPGFQVDLNPIPIADETRYIYLDVKTTDGSARNVFDIWAGLPSVASELDPNVNVRNLQIANNPTLYQVKGVGIYALGRLPLQFYVDENVKFPLAPVDTSMGGGTIYASTFDFESTLPVIFTIDGLDLATFRERLTVSTTPDLSADPRTVTCGGDTDCNAEWTSPQMPMGVPSSGSFFFGGDLMAEYPAGADAQTWWISVTAGRPFLID